MDENVTTKKTYICTGSCGAHITEEEYNNGLTACGTEGCSMKGHPFVEESADVHGGHVVINTNDKDDDTIINN